MMMFQFLPIITRMSVQICHIKVPNFSTQRFLIETRTLYPKVPKCDELENKSEALSYDRVTEVMSLGHSDIEGRPRS